MNVIQIVFLCAVCFVAGVAFVRFVMWYYTAGVRACAILAANSIIREVMPPPWTFLITLLFWPVINLYEHVPKNSEHDRIWLYRLNTAWVESVVIPYAHLLIEEAEKELDEVPEQFHDILGVLFAEEMDTDDEEEDDDE